MAAGRLGLFARPWLAADVATIPDVSARVVERDAGSAEEGGRVTLRKPVGGFRATLLRLARQPTDFTIHLDELGSAAWRLFDGRRTVAQVRAELELAFPGQSDIGPRLGKFLGILVSREFVKLR
jgi:hypothetical protein